MLELYQRQPMLRCLRLPERYKKGRTMATDTTSNGIRRRHFLTAGALGSLGLTLSGYLRLAAGGRVAARAPARGAIFIQLSGGPSHLDTFDMKPAAPAEYRGTFRPIATNVPGIEICEHLPKLACCADKFAIVRGVTHTLAAHQLASQYVNPGAGSLASLPYPGDEAVVVKDIALRGGLTRAPMPRQPLRPDSDGRLQAIEQQSQLVEGLDPFSQEAWDILNSPRSRAAFDISQESAAFAEPFRDDPFAIRCLLACRLIESGVRFVTLSMGGWDTHQENFTRLRESLLPKLDTGLSALLQGLEQKGLLASTAVLATGEFGRTPKINDRSADGGRDHHPRCMFMLMAGGAVRGGQVVGQSDQRAMQPAGEGFSPSDVAASFYHNLGIDQATEYHTELVGPISRAGQATVIRKLFA